MSPLLSNVLLDELEKELERFLAERLRLKVNPDKRAVARPWERKFLGYSVTVHREPKLRVAAESVRRLKVKLKPILRRGRGRTLAGVAEELGPVLRGWAAYYRMAEVKGSSRSWTRGYAGRCNASSGGNGRDHAPGFTNCDGAGSKRPRPLPRPTTGTERGGMLAQAT